MISRDWQCGNGRCRAVFHSYDHSNPPCPHCGCVRVAWVPGGGHISSTRGVDATLKSLAASYGMSDINSPSPSRLNRAMPKHDPAVADSPIMKQFAPGFLAPWNMQGRATCEPSRQKVDFKVSAEPNKPMPPQSLSKAIGFNAVGPQIGASSWKNMRRPYKG